ncbi:UNKNOWN [Stylonychia lemnae]|uniref:Uncharacterized protein n=1 Tax=Stylonychia lemnae TaxID=5949 RepID=A0A078A4Y0_STYLE|nr:UNKNOWN [Stylonychia lemnae]|eukprot:CDW77320.1 UNKNOWN [Stylonychia lemnae]
MNSSQDTNLYQNDSDQQVRVNNKDDKQRIYEDQLRLFNEKLHQISQTNQYLNKKLQSQVEQLQFQNDQLLDEIHKLKQKSRQKRNYPNKDANQTRSKDVNQFRLKENVELKHNNSMINSVDPYHELERKISLKCRQNSVQFQNESNLKNHNLSQTLGTFSSNNQSSQSNKYIKPLNFQTPQKASSKSHHNSCLVSNEKSNSLTRPIFYLDFSRLQELNQTTQTQKKPFSIDNYPLEIKNADKTQNRTSKLNQRYNQDDYEDEDDKVSEKFFDALNTTQICIEDKIQSFLIGQKHDSELRNLAQKQSQNQRQSLLNITNYKGISQNIYEDIIPSKNPFSRQQNHCRNNSIL